MDAAEILGPDVLDRLPAILPAPALRAQLDYSVVFARRLDHLPAFPDAVRDRFLDIDVLAGLACQDGAERVPMVGRGDNDGVHIIVVEHPAEILHKLRTLAADAFYRRAPILQQAAVTVGQVRQLDILAFGKPFGKSVAPSVDSHHPHDNPLVCTEHLARNQRRRSRGQSSADRSSEKLPPFHRLRVHNCLLSR